MNIPSKIAKSNYFQPDRILEHQNASIKYYKQYSKTKKQNEIKTNKKGLKEEILSWFFSLDLITKLIITSIENKWVTNLLYQLYVHQITQPNRKFQIKEGELINLSSANPSNSPKLGPEYCQQILRLNVSENAGSPAAQNGSFSVGNNFFNSSSLHMDCFNYLTYFTNRDDSSTINNYIYKTNTKSEDDFINEINFYKSEELLLDLEFEKINKYSNYFTLSEKLVQDENLFKYYFENLSGNQAFNYLIPATLDSNSKHCNIFLPEWIKSKEFYSTSEIFAAFFEQVITVKYIIYKHNPQNFKPKSYLEQIFVEKDIILKFLKNLKKRKNSPSEFLINYIKDKKIIKNLYEDKNVMESITNKTCQKANIYHSFNSNNFSSTYLIFDPVKFTSEEIEKRLEYTLKNYENDVDGESKFIEKIVYFKIDKIFTYDDYFLRIIFEFLNVIIQKESYNDLMNENDFENDYLEKTMTTKKKKKKKNKESICNERKGSKIEKKEDEAQVVTEYEEFMSSNPNKDKKFNFNFIKKKKDVEESKYYPPKLKNEIKTNSQITRNNEYNNYIKKEFLGEIMLIKNENSSELPEIERTVKDIIEEILSSICFNLKFEFDYEKDVNKNFNTQTKSDLVIDNGEINVKKIKPDELAFNYNKAVINKLHEAYNTNITDMLNDIDHNPCLSDITPDLINNNNINLKFGSQDNYVSVSEKLGSPYFSEKNEQIDTDITYSSDGALSNNANANIMPHSKAKNRKKSKNKFFLYDLNKSNKKFNALKEKENLFKSNNNKNIISVSHKFGTENINSRKNSYLSERKNSLSTKIDNQDKINNNININEGTSFKTNNPPNNDNIHNIINKPIINQINNSDKNLLDRSSYSINNKSPSFMASKNKLFLDEETSEIKEKFSSNEGMDSFKISSEKDARDLKDSSKDNIYVKNINTNNLNNANDSSFKQTFNNFNKFSKINFNINVYNINNFNNTNNLNFGCLPYKNFMGSDQLYFNNFGGVQGSNFGGVPGGSFGGIPGGNFGGVPGGVSFNNFYGNSISGNLKNSSSSYENYLGYPNNKFGHYPTFSPPIHNNYLHLSSNDFFIHHNPIYFEIFQMRFHKDITTYFENTENILKYVKPVKASSIIYLEKQIKEFFNEIESNLKTTIEIYGSFASELDIESSDIDMAIKFDDPFTSDIDYIYLMKKLVEKLIKLNLLESVVPIYTASVPVIKIIINPLKIIDEKNLEKLKKFKETEIYNKYSFNREEIEIIKIDLTFHEIMKKKNNNINVSEKHVEFIKNSCLVYPEIKPIIKIFKRFFHINKLNCSFNGILFNNIGGLSSFSLFILILAYTKFHKLNINNGVVNLGKLMVEFLMYYGSYMDFNITIIDSNLEK